MASRGTPESYPASSALADYAATSKLCFDMRRFPLLVLGFVLLSACGGGSTANVCDRGYFDGAIGACVPEGWQVFDRAALDIKGMPPEVVVAFQSETPSSGQFVTVTVTRETLAQPISSSDYSAASIQSVQGLPGYEEADRKSITIDEEDLDIHIFTAQPSSDQPASRFYQLSAVAEGIGYTFTAATPVTVDDEVEEQVISILESATFVQPEDVSEGE